MKKIILAVIFSATLVTALQAQFLKKLANKVNQAIDKKVDKTIDSTFNKSTNGSKTNTDNNSQATNKTNIESTAQTGAKTDNSNPTVYSKFDFVPGTTILYYDNFEKDNIGETPLGWITSTSAEVVTINGLEGKWLKMAGRSKKQFTRSKKQSWGNNFTIEFDLLIVKNTYDPRIDFWLFNSGGNLVTDESILQNDNPVLELGTILGNGGKTSRATLKGFEGVKISDNMSGNLPYSNTTPVHISICVQGKRFRMWWNDLKQYDLSAINEQYLPNQFGFNCSSDGSDFYVSNIRIAKDVPDTRSQFDEGKLVSNLLFYTGTSRLKPESMGSLLDLSKVLKDATTTVKIVGHTDNVGDDAGNLKLSQERADAVKGILVKEYGIDAGKLTTEGRGQTQPIANNNTAEGKAQNRRVEFIFKPEADKYIPLSGTIANRPPATTNSAKPTSVNSSNTSNIVTVTIQSKILETNLPYAQFIKTSDSKFTFIASKEEGNQKENYFKIDVVSTGTNLKAETYNFNEINRKNPLYGSKQFAEISNTEAVLYYGGTQKPYIYDFSPIIANGSTASYVSASLVTKLPPASPNAKLVIEKIENRKASGYFIAGIKIQGLKPVTKGDAEKETFTDGYAGEIKCNFSNVPVY